MEGKLGRITTTERVDIVEPCCYVLLWSMQGHGENNNSSTTPTSTASCCCFSWWGLNLLFSMLMSTITILVFFHLQLSFQRGERGLTSILSHIFHLIYYWGGLASTGARCRLPGPCAEREGTMVAWRLISESDRELYFKDHRAYFGTEHSRYSLYFSCLFFLWDFRLLLIARKDSSSGPAKLVSLVGFICVPFFIINSLIELMAMLHLSFFFGKKRLCNCNCCCLWFSGFSLLFVVPQFMREIAIDWYQSIVWLQPPSLHEMVKLKCLEKFKKLLFASQEWKLSKRKNLRCCWL